MNNVVEINVKIVIISKIYTKKGLEK